MATSSNARPSPAMVVALIALFVAVGGTAIALPGTNRVNSGDVKNETLRTQDLKDGAAVQSSDVIDESLLTEDIANNTLQSDDYGDGTVGSDDLGFNSVNGSAIQSNAVGSSEITTDAVGGTEIDNDGVAAADIAAGAVGSVELATIIEVVDATPVDFGDQDEGNNDYEFGSSTADCPVGTVVIGGGGEFIGGTMGGTGGDELQAIHESQRSGQGWTAVALSDVDNQDFRAFAYCLSTGT